MVLSIVLYNLKKIILNLKHLLHMALLPMCLYNLSGTKNNNKTSIQITLFFFFNLIAPYNIPEPMNTSAMSWDPYVVRWSPCSNSHWWIRSNLSFLHHQNIPLFPITYSLAPSQPFTATIGLVPLYSGLPCWLRW